MFDLIVLKSCAIIDIQILQLKKIDIEKDGYATMLGGGWCSTGLFWSNPYWRGLAGGRSSTASLRDWAPSFDDEPVATVDAYLFLQIYLSNSHHYQIYPNIYLNISTFRYIQARRRASCDCVRLFVPPYDPPRYDLNMIHIWFKYDSNIIQILTIQILCLNSEKYVSTSASRSEHSGFLFPLVQILNGDCQIKY